MSVHREEAPPRPQTDYVCASGTDPSGGRPTQEIQLQLPTNEENGNKESETDIHRPRGAAATELGMRGGNGISFIYQLLMDKIKESIQNVQRRLAKFIQQRSHNIPPLLNVVAFLHQYIPYNKYMDR